MIWTPWNGHDWCYSMSSTVWRLCFWRTCPQCVYSPETRRFLFHLAWTNSRRPRARAGLKQGYVELEQLSPQTYSRSSRGRIGVGGARPSPGALPRHPGSLGMLSWSAMARGSSWS
eukprot:235075-Pyramimonas_sp.AAC.1